MRILLADDHDLVRETLSAFLQKDGELFVQMVESFPAAIEAVEGQEQFDLILLDYKMPGMMGLDGLDAMLAKDPGCGVAILSGNAPANIAQEAISRGAVGFLPKTMSAQSLLNAVKFMIAGEIYFPAPQKIESFSQNGLVDQLTDREREVLSGLCRGLSNKEIARELDLQEVTIKLHMRTLSKKLDAKNRTHAAMIAKELGLF